MRHISRSILVAVTLLLAACGAGATGGPLPTQTSPTAPEQSAPASAPTHPAWPTAAPEPAGTGQAGTVAAGVVVTYHKGGGIAAIDERLTVYADGTLQLRRRGGGARIVQVAPSELSELQKLLASPEFAGLKPSYQAPGADQFVYELTVPGGATITTVDGAQNPPVLDQVLAELEKLKGQVK